jgi:GT2 family glycosyltransferase
LTVSQPRVAVVVCCYTEQRWDDLVAALASVDNQTRPADDVVIVVDHAPELFARLRRSFPDHTIVDNRSTAGLSGARNTGVAETDADIVAFLDDDAVAAPDWLEHLCAPYADPDVMAVGGRVDPQWDERRPRWFPREFDWVVGCTYAGHAPEGPIRNVIGANMSFRRALVDEVGGFDERVGRVGTNPAGCEETELCIRVRQHRPEAVVWYAPAATVAHRVRPERATFAYFRARCRAEGGSKARVASMVGADDGLSSERSYALSTLPRATLVDVRSTVGSGDVGALGRSLARGSGMALAGVGYLTTMLTTRRHASILGSTPDFRPAIVATASIGSSAAPVPVTGSSTGGYSRALVLVKDGDRPAGVVALELDERGLAAPDIAMQLRSGVAPDDAVWVHPMPVSVSSDADTAPPHVTVVVATLGTPDVLRRCLGSILDSDYPSFDVLVVDNTVDSGSAGEVVEEFGSAVRWVREARPGLANAHNRALLEPTGAILAFTDDDVVVDRTWIRTLVAAFGAASDVVCVTGMIFPMEIETPAQELVERSIGYGKGFDRQLHRLAPPSDDSPLFPYASGRFGSGANMAFRAQWLRRAGGFDPALGTGTAARGGDDLAAFYRTVAAGSALVYEPAAIVYHAHRREEAALPRQSFGYGAGLTAYLASLVAEDPGRAGDIARRVVPGLRYAFGKKSARNVGRGRDYPRVLRLREVAGMAAGPFLYLRSRRQNPAAGPFPTVPEIEAGREAVSATS